MSSSYRRNKRIPRVVPYEPSQVTDESHQSPDILDVKCSEISDGSETYHGETRPHVPCPASNQHAVGTNKGPTAFVSFQSGSLSITIDNQSLGGSLETRLIQSGMNQSNCSSEDDSSQTAMFLRANPNGLMSIHQVAQFEALICKEMRSRMRVKLLNVILQSQKRDVLKRFTKSPKVCETLLDWMRQAFRQWDTTLIQTIFNALYHLPFDFSTIVKYNLSRAVGKIDKKIALDGPATLKATSDKLLAKWRGQHAEYRETSATEDDPIAYQVPTTTRVSPQPQPNRRSQQTNTNTVRNTAVFKKMDMLQERKNMAKSTHSPTDSTTSTSSSSSTSKKSYANVDNLLDQWNDTCETTVLTAHKTKEPASTTLNDKPKTKPKKTVRFETDCRLVEIIGLTYVPWYRPQGIMFDKGIRRLGPILTEEAKTQEDRVRYTLTVVYLSQDFIPHSPGEPDPLDTSESRHGTYIKIIPLEDQEPETPLEPLTPIDVVTCNASTSSYVHKQYMQHN